MSVAEVDVVAARPEVDAEVQVTAVRGSLTVTARVEDAGTATVVVRPSVGDFVDGAVVDVGEQVTVLWLTADGARAVPAEVATVGRGIAPRWRLSVVGPAEAVQRRQAVRTRLALPMTAVVNGADVGGEILDLSEGGVRAVVEAFGHPPLSGDVISVSVHLEGGDVTAPAEVVRHQQTRDGRWGVSLRFVDLPEREQDRLRRCVFQALREERARNTD